MHPATPLILAIWSSLELVRKKKKSSPKYRPKTSTAEKGRQPRPPDGRISLLLAPSLINFSPDWLWLQINKTWSWNLMQIRFQALGKCWLLFQICLFFPLLPSTLYLMRDCELVHFFIFQLLDSSRTYWL